MEIGLRFNDHLIADEACLALDLTARDIQKKAQSEGLPWTLAKSFSGACPLGPFFPYSGKMDDWIFELFVNGSLRQKGDPKEMIFKPKQLIETLLSRFPVCPGDLLLTGTPAGVSAARKGDRLEAKIEGKTVARWSVL